MSDRAEHVCYISGTNLDGVPVRYTHSHALDLVRNLGRSWPKPYTDLHVLVARMDDSAIDLIDQELRRDGCEKALRRATLTAVAVPLAVLSGCVGAVVAAVAVVMFMGVPVWTYPGGKSILGCGGIVGFVVAARATIASSAKALRLPTLFEKGVVRPLIAMCRPSAIPTLAKLSDSFQAKAREGIQLAIVQQLPHLTCEIWGSFDTRRTAQVRALLDVRDWQFATSRNVVIAALEATARVEDIDALPAVERLTRSEIGRGKVPSRIREAANVCARDLTIARERLRTSRALLRASNEPGGVTLLRAAHDVAGSAPDFLLRSVNSSGRDAAENVFSNEIDEEVRRRSVETAR